MASSAVTPITNVTILSSNPASADILDDLIKPYLPVSGCACTNGRKSRSDVAVCRRGCTRATSSPRLGGKILGDGRSPSPYGLRVYNGGGVTAVIEDEPVGPPLLQTEIHNFSSPPTARQEVLPSSIDPPGPLKIQLLRSRPLPKPSSSLHI